jgi:hypothetical protein
MYKLLLKAMGKGHNYKDQNIESQKKHQKPIKASEHRKSIKASER